MIKKRNYWGYRICNEKSAFFYEELKEGRLRQGWGYDTGQNLRNMTIDNGAKKNLKMYNEVKKGDILLVPRIPSWEDISIVEATEDWLTGYSYDIPKEIGDFGHIFPARFVKAFNRYNPYVSDKIRSSFHYIGRFWDMNDYENDIISILEREDRLVAKDYNLHNEDTPNLFDYATSELSQDAFLLWLLNWANGRYKKYDQDLYQTAQLFVKMLLDENEDTIINSIKTYKQLKNIDVFAVVNEKYAIIIEDKVNTGTHDDQLRRYKEWISLHNEFKNLKLICVYLKTGNESLSYLKRIEEDEKYNIVLRKDLLEVLQKYNGNNSIVTSFYRHLAEIENETNSFKISDVKNWSWNAWQGFYMELEQKLNINIKQDAWFYVANPNGGFLGFNWHWRVLHNCRIYMQFEQGPLCIKIECYDMINRTSIRNAWSEIVIRKAIESGCEFVRKPDRFGNGTYMTIAIIYPMSLFSEKKVDIDLLISRINRIESLIDDL